MKKISYSKYFGLVILFMAGMSNPLCSINKGQYRGFGLNTGTEGSGITLNYQWNVADKVSLGVESRLFDIKADDEFVTYNSYTGRYESINDQSLIILPFFGGGSFYPFEGAIANNASPFITAKFGPVISFDGDETINGFFNRWQKANGYFSLGGYIGLGIEMLWANRMTIAIGIGRDILPMRVTIDGKTSYSGTVLSFTFYQRR